MADSDIKIYGALRAMTGDGIAAYAEQIYDEESGKYLPELLEESGGGGGINQAQIGYFTCSTAADIAAKTISATGYTLERGGNIRIKMSNANTVDNVTLNINNTGAQPLYYNGTAAGANNSWSGGEIIEVYYNGSRFEAQTSTSHILKNGFKKKLYIVDESGNKVGYIGSDSSGKVNIKANDSTFTLQATAYDAETQQTATTGRLNITKAGDVTLESSDDLKLYGGSDVKIDAQNNVEVSAAQYAMLTSGFAAFKVRNDGDINIYSSGGKDVCIRNGGDRGKVRLHATPNNVRLRASENCNMTVNAPVDETATPIVYNNNIRLACGDVEFYLKTFDAQGQQVGNDDIYSLREILTASVVRTQLITTPPATLNAQAGYYYCIDGSNVVVNTMTIQLPSIADYENKAQNVSFFMTMGSTPAVTFVSPSNERILYQKDFALEAGKTYEVNALYQGYRIGDNPTKTWVIAAVEIEIPTT